MFKNDLKEGEGTYTWPKGERFAESKHKGNWKNGKRDGQGECWYHDGSHYKGAWKDDVKAGDGTYTWGNNEEGKSTYIGKWSMDQKHGNGKMTWRDGTIFDGTWHQGELGAGKLTDKDGKKHDIK